jgi:hypothetical protein
MGLALGTLAVGEGIELVGLGAAAGETAAAAATTTEAVSSAAAVSGVTAGSAEVFGAGEAVSGGIELTELGTGTSAAVTSVTAGSGEVFGAGETITGGIEMTELGTGTSGITTGITAGSGEVFGAGEEISGGIEMTEFGTGTSGITTSVTAGSGEVFGAGEAVSGGIEMTEFGTGTTAGEVLGETTATTGAETTSTPIIQSGLGSATLQQTGNLISVSTGVPGFGELGAGISEATGAETLGSIHTAITSAFETEGAIGAGEIEMTELGGATEAVTESETLGLGETTTEELSETNLEEFGIDSSEFNALDVEASEEFEQISEEAKGMYEQLKDLGKDVIDKIKRAILLCRQNPVTAATCAIELEHLIKKIYDKYFEAKKIITDFTDVNAFSLGRTLGKLTIEAISGYYHAVIKNPNILNNEKALDRIILSSFTTTNNIYHSSLAAIATKIVKASLAANKIKINKRMNEIRKVYNGKLQRMTFRNSNGKIAGIDETGKTIVYDDVSYPNSKTTFWGTFTGPKSHNDTYVIEDGEEPEPGHKARPAGSGLLDTFAFFHDCEYSKKSTGGSYFNISADLRLISRCEQTISRMTYREAMMARTTIAYFSTIGVIIGSYINPGSIEFEPQPVTGKAGDIYDQITTNGQPDQESKTHFYQGLKEAIDEGHVNFIKSNGGGTNSNSSQNTGLLEAFLNIEIFEDD